jgi:hypothetical protein
LRLDVAEKDAAVYVDRYYAGSVDDFDGVFQYLALTTGPHTIEIRKAGFETLTFRVNIPPNQTVTYRETMRPAPPGALPSEGAAPGDRPCVPDATSGSGL